jgi:hypothetical protein
MNKICKLSAIALLASSTSLMAQTFSGPYVGVSGSIAGFATDASKTSSDNTTNGAGNGPVGKITPLAALDLGYGIPAGSGTTIAIGATYTPMKAELDGKGTDNARGQTHKFEIKDHFTIYVQPTFEINKDSAFFVKAFYAHADTSATNLTKAPGDLEGFGGSTGLKVMLTKNAFVQVEAAYTKYDTLTATDTSIGGQGGSITRTYKAEDPELAEGRITVGYKF